MNCNTYSVEFVEIGLRLARLRAEKEGSHVPLLLQVVDDVTESRCEPHINSQALPGQVCPHFHEEKAGRQTQQ